MLEFDFDINNKAASRESSCKKIKNDEDECQVDDDSDEGSAPSVQAYSLKSLSQQPGHTGYLTFATLLNKQFT